MKREWRNLTYMNPTKLLVGMSEMFDSSGLLRHPNPADLLMNRRVRAIAEDRRCAIFCHGAGQVFNTKILFAPCESSDYDYVGAYQHEGKVIEFPIQMKQLVPDRINTKTCLQTEVDKLKKYSGARDLVVAIHVNRRIHLHERDIDVSGLNIKEIWLFGKMNNGTDDWLLLGNLMADSLAEYRFQLPKPAPQMASIVEGS